MSKYDFENDLSQGTSTGIILNQIDSGSVVLEFGCATGRMTRYMKENLGCQVYIVEYDRNAYEVALQYAEDGLCDDILNFRWADKFSGIAFDAIVFADVLEHLSDPERVLACAAKLLRENGRLYVSLPNITHNDILLKAYAEHFDYTETGLLDDTHVHFWGLENIKQLSGKCGLTIRKVEGTYCPMGSTEQYDRGGRTENLLLENILRERQCGEVYQFVVTFDRSEAADAIYSFRTPTVRSHVYFDTGNGFHPEEMIAFDSVYTGLGCYTVHCEVESTGNIRRLRLDPVEFQSCILQDFAVRQGEEELPVIYPEGLRLENGYLLTGTDPMVWVDVLPSADPIVIDARLVLPGAEYQRLLEVALGQRWAEIEHLHRIFADEREYLRTQMKAQADESAGLRTQIAMLTGENEELQRDVCSYIILANNKEKYALALKDELAERARYAQTLEQRVSYYQNLNIIKLGRFIRRILRGIKRRMKRVLHKGGHA